MYFAQQFSELSAAFEIVFSQLPLFDERQIANKLVLSHKNLPSAAAAHAELSKFCREMQAIVDYLLASKTDSAKPIKFKQFSKTLSAGKFVLADGTELKINTFAYLKAAAMKENIMATLKASKTIVLLEILQEVLAKNIAHLSQHHTSANQPVAPDKDAVAKISYAMATKLDSQASFKYLTAIENLLEKFDTAIMRIYDCPVTLLYNEIPILLLTVEASLENRFDNIARCKKLIAKSLLDKEVLFVLSKDRNAVIVSGLIKMHYYYAIQRLRAFALALDKRAKRLIPKKAKEKTKLLNAFNREIKDAIKNLPVLFHEKQLKKVLVAGVQKSAVETDEDDNEEVRIENFEIDFPEAEHDNAETKDNLAKKATKDEEQPGFTVTVIGRDVKQSDFVADKHYQFCVVNDDPFLLAEASLAHKILRIDWLLEQVARIFANTPKHLYQVEKVLTENHVAHYLQMVLHDNSILHNNYQQVLRHVSDTEFAFERHAELLAVGDLINSQINPAIQAAQGPLPVASMFAARIVSLQSILKNIINANKMLSKFNNYYPQTLLNAIALNKKRHELADKLNQMAAEMQTLSQGGTTLAALEIWLDRSRKPLDLLQADIANTQSYLANAQTAFAKTAVLTDANKMEELTAQYQDVNRLLNIFQVHYQKADAELKSLSVLLANANLRRQGHFHLFNPVPVATFSPADEKKSTPAISPNNLKIC